MVVIDAGRGRRTASIPVAGGPAAGSSHSAVTAGAGSIWVANADANTVSRIDPELHLVIETIPVGHGPAGIAFGAGFVWVTESLDGTVSKIDPRTNTPVHTIDVGNGPDGIAAGARDVWVANAKDRTVTRIDTTTDTAQKTTAVAAGADGVAVGGGSVWVTGQSTGIVTRIDARTGEILGTIPAGNGATAVAFEAGSVWVANSLDDTVARIDPSSHDVAKIPVGDGPNGIALTTGGVWVSNELSRTVMKIDRRRNTVVRTVGTGERPEGIVQGIEALFVPVRASGAGHYGGTLTVLANKGLIGLDPATAYAPLDVQLLAFTNNGLVGFRRVSGSAGSRLVPDLAVSLPIPTDGGKTYRFQVRPNIRYSTGAIVRPADFRRGIERSLVQGVTGDAFSRILGARACLAAPTRRCDLSQGIVAERATPSRSTSPRPIRASSSSSRSPRRTRCRPGRQSAPVVSCPPPVRTCSTPRTCSTRAPRRAAPFASSAIRGSASGHRSLSRAAFPTRSCCASGARPTRTSRQSSRARPTWRST